MRYGTKALVALVVVLLAIPAAALAETEAPGAPVQLELGDSWTYGDGASDPRSTGYAAIVHARNRTTLDCVPGTGAEVEHCRNLRRVTLARPGTAENPGVTTQRLIDEQLESAVRLASDRNGDANPANDVEVVVVTVGGNDLSRPVLEACLAGLDANCLGVIVSGTARVEANLDEILGQVRAATGPGTTIVIGTYDNAIAHCPLGQTPGAAALGALVLEGHPGLGIEGLNDVIRRVAAEHDVRVAELFGRLGPDQWVGDCLHPNDAGYAEIADVFSDAIDR